MDIFGIIVIVFIVIGIFSSDDSCDIYDYYYCDWLCDWGIFNDSDDTF